MAPRASPKVRLNDAEICQRHVGIGVHLDGALRARQRLAYVALLEVAARQDDQEAGSLRIVWDVGHERRGQQVLAAADDALSRRVDDRVGLEPISGRPVVMGRDAPIASLGMGCHGPVQVANRLGAEVAREPRLQELADERVIPQFRSRVRELVARAG